MNDVKNWEDIVQIEPKLLELENDIRNEDDSDPHFCANVAWYEKFKPRLLRLAGWDARKPELRTSTVYEIAVDYLYEQLPDCKVCGCLVLY